MAKTIGIKEIAELAGVSAATVSRVINQNGRFSEETGRRVRKIIAENNYTPNMSAKGLRTSNTQVVGIVVPDITNAHFANLVLKLEMRLFRHGYSCMICNTNESETLEKKHVQSLAAQNVSGIILISGTRDYAELGSLPIIYLDRPSKNMRETGIMIESDNEEGGYLATRELLEAGCREILMLKCLVNSDCNQMNRYNGYLRALQEADVEERAELRVSLPEVSTTAARELTERLLEQGVHFDGVMCTTDTLAAGALLALRSHGLRVPEDVRVTGFDDSRLAEVCGPGLTSVHQNVDEMAYLATSLFMQLANGETVEQTHYRLPVTLVRRNSTLR